MLLLCTQECPPRRRACRSVWKLAVRNLLRQRSRNLLLGVLIVFSSFAIVYFSMLLAGAQRNFSHQLVALATGDVYVAARAPRNADRIIIDGDYQQFRHALALRTALDAAPAPMPALEGSQWHSGTQVFADLTGAMELGYAIVIAIVMVMVAASLAFTTMLNITARSHEIATLAALGATACRIRRLLVSEIGLLALVAALLGMALALAAFAATAGTHRELGGFPGSRFHPAWNGAGFVAGLLLPLTVALLASSFFAWRAARLPIAATLAAR